MLLLAALFVFVLAVMFALAKVQTLIEFSDALSIYDESDAHRKSHAAGISRLGGLGICSAFLAALLLSVDLGVDEIYSLLCSSAIICIVGLKDDLCGGLQPLEKLFFQILVGLYCIQGGTGITEDKPFSEQICILAIIVFFINAFNLIDGINGLAAGLGVLVNAIFGWMFIELQEVNWSLISFAIAGSVAGFLRYNFFKGHIFMGDSGAMLIGLVSIVSAIKLVALCGIVISDRSMVWQSAAPGVCLAVLIVPVFDALRVVLERAIRLRSPFIGDRNHVHHQLQSLGLPDPLIVLLLLIFNVLLIVISLFLSELGSWFVAVVLFVLCSFAQCVLNRLKSRQS